MEDSRDPRFSIENSEDSKLDADAQPEDEKEENPLPVDFYRPTPGQSEYSYLFDEQDEIDPYDYVMQKVQQKKNPNSALQEDSPAQHQPKQPREQLVPKQPEKSQQPLSSRKTVERDLALDEPKGGEKKSLRESLGDLLRRVTSTARIRNEFVRGEHDKSDVDGTEPEVQEDIEQRVNRLIRNAERKVSEQAAKEHKDKDVNMQQQDSDESVGGQETENLPAEKPDEEVPKQQKAAEDEPKDLFFLQQDQPAEPDQAAEAERPDFPQGYEESDLSEEPQMLEEVPEATETPEIAETPEIPEQPQTSADLQTVEEEPSVQQPEEKLPLHSMRETEVQNEPENASQEEITEEPEKSKLQPERMNHVQVLPVTEPILRQEFLQREPKTAPRQPHSICIELDADNLFSSKDLPEVRLDEGETGCKELHMEYALITGKSIREEAIPAAATARTRWLPFLNRKKQKDAPGIHPQTEKSHMVDAVHQKENYQKTPQTKATEKKRSASGQRETVSKSDRKKTGDDPDSHPTPADAAKALRKRISREVRNVFLRLIFVGVIAVCLAVPAVCARIGVELGAWFSPVQNPRFFAAINLLGILICLVLCRSMVLVGLLSYFKGQKEAGADCAFSIAAIACALQALVATIRPDALAAGDIWLYAPVAAFGLCGNLIGKLCMMLRTKENFCDLCAVPDRLALVRLEEESRVQKIVDSDVPGRLTVGAVKTVPSQDFLRNSLQADFGERNVERIFTFGFFGALVAALITYFSSPQNNYDAALGAYTAVCCICAPFTATLAVNLPLRRICRVLRKNGVVAVNAQAAEQFGETGCVILRDEELFPADAVVLNGIKTLSSSRVDDAILDAAALLREAGGPMRTVFQRVIRGQTGILPQAEQVVAEPGGFSGWVQGRRVFVGSSELMAAHGITPPSRDYEAKNCPSGTIPVYLARSGELSALFTVEYNADPVILDAVQKLVQNGADMAVLTTDSNLSAAMVAAKFEISEESVTMVPDTQELHETDVQPEDLERQIVVTRSPGAPVLVAASCCIGAKATFQLAVLLQMVGILLGLALVFVFSAAGSIAQIGVTEMIVFQTFWMLACLVIPAVKRF